MLRRLAENVPGNTGPSLENTRIHQFRLELLDKVVNLSD